MKWQLQRAKAQLSALVKKAISQGPQTITVRDEPVVVILSKKEYDKLVQPKESFVEFMRKSPLIGVKLNITRDKSLPRDIDL